MIVVTDTSVVLNLCLLGLEDVLVTLFGEASFDDPVIREVREIRDRLAMRFDNDLGKVAQDLMERQAIHGSRLLERPVND